MIIGIGVSSCQKEDDENVQPGTGIIKVSVSWSPYIGGSQYVYFLSENFTVRLKKNGSTIATQSTAGGTLDMGIYEYGTYQVHVTGREGRTNVTTGQTNNSNEVFDETKTLVLDAPTKTATFSFD